MFPMDKEAALVKLGKQIQRIRKNKGMTQVQLAHSLNKDQQSIQRLEAGKFNPSYIYLTEIATGLGVSIDVLVREESDTTLQ